MRRSGDNFKESDLCVLDFDDAANLDDAINYEFNDYQHIIGTTKRHDILGDRFRVVIPWDKKILGVDAFIDNMRYLAKNYGADIQASNAAVKFMPCTEVVSVKSSGDKMERLKRTKTRERYLEEKRIKQDGAKPWLIKWFMDNPVGDGERGTRCFQFGCEAVKASIERQDAFNMIIESGMISDWTDWNHHLVWQNLNGGYRHLRERSRD